MNKLAKTVDWDLSSIDDVNKAFYLLLEKKNFILENSTKLISKKQTRKDKKDWITNAIKKSCEKKQKLYNLWRNEPHNQ